MNIEKLYSLRDTVLLSSDVEGTIYGRTLSEPAFYDIKLEDGTMLMNVREDILNKGLSHAEIKHLKAHPIGR